jgi:transposase-like protein
MARNPIQFQKGMSLKEFNQKYGTEEQCEAALAAWRWPGGFVCPHCGGKEHAIVGMRRLYSCHGCRRQTSLKSGTIFSRTLLPLVAWFQAMWLITQSKNSISTLELSRQLGVKWDSAHLMRHKLMSVMVEREAARKLDGRVEMDDAVLGGEKSEPDG